jgi:hypothetical protein
MMVRTLTTLVLALSIACAAPLAVEAWLRGAHVTAEQGLRHTLVVAAHGVHDHTADHQASGTPLGADAGLSAASTGFAFSGLWLAVGVSGLALLALVAHRRGRQGDYRHPSGHIFDIALPPPRARALARISIVEAHG